MNSQGLHEPLSSVSEPTTPTEEDLAKASAWDDGDTSKLVSTKWKGKGKQDDGGEHDHSVRRERSQNGTDEYPPMATEELELRKIEQNLKRWETLEKQRRKKARESRTGKGDSSLSSSFSVGDVSRRASLLWGGRTKSRSDRESDSRPRARTTGHQVLEDVDELPMEATGPPSASSPVDTPRPSISDNPFDDAANIEKVQSQLPQSDALMTAASPESLPSTPRPTTQKRVPARPILQVQASSYTKPPPPKPLDLPYPTTQEERAQEEARLEMEEGQKHKKWWTEWLCGCREDGDDQAGRTNPME